MLLLNTNSSGLNELILIKKTTAVAKPNPPAAKPKENLKKNYLLDLLSKREVNEEDFKEILDDENSSYSAVLQNIKDVDNYISNSLCIFF